MKFKHLFLALVLLMAGLIAISCVSSSGDDGDGDGTNPPNFVGDACGGCPAEQYIGSTGIIFFSYVKNNGGDGTVSMTIGSGSNTTTQQFNVSAGTKYSFQASVPVEVSASTSFTYLAQFPGTPGFTDSHAISGYHVTGAPSGMQFTAR
ncbi:MAG: hypothetical protein NTZ12_06195 [Candidatus Aminicenantes bacterium]|nr:hypothetical protein [Candidatus Aminicenantes bacterium]